MNYIFCLEISQRLLADIITRNLRTYKYVFMIYHNYNIIFDNLFSNKFLNLYLYIFGKF